MTGRAELHRPTPFMEPSALGIPVADFLDGFNGEACDAPPQTLRFELHDTEADAVQIVRTLSRLVKAYSRNECVVGFARCLVSGGLVDNARRAQFDRIGAWVMSNLVYQADPRGIEFVTSPVQLLRQWYRDGVAYGDCDDHVLLLNSLLGALGFDTKVVAVELPDQPGYLPGVMNHVLSRVRLPEGWRDFDPCNKQEPWKRYSGERLEA